MPRRFRLAIAGAALTGLSGLGLLVQSTPAFAASSPSDAEQFIADINALRASVGVGPLKESSVLDSMAQGWSLHLESVGTLSHNPSLAASAPSNWQKLGENVGVGPTVSALQTAFTNSPEHYTNMVDPSFNQIGVNVEVDTQGSLWVTEDYMEAPLVAPAPTSTATPVVKPAPVSAPAPAPVVHSVPTVVHASPAPVVKAAQLPAAVAAAAHVPAPVVASAPAPTPTTTAPAVTPLAATAPAPVASGAPISQGSALNLPPVAAQAPSADLAGSVTGMAKTAKRVASLVLDLCVVGVALVMVLMVFRPRRHRRTSILT